jgi:hypothetical protein
MMKNEGKASKQTGKYNEQHGSDKLVLVNMMVEANVQDIAQKIAQ